MKILIFSLISLLFTAFVSLLLFKLAPYDAKAVPKQEKCVEILY